MQNPRLAARYAKSLLDIAVEQNQLDRTLSDVKLINEVSSQSREFANVLRSPVINADKKQAVIEAVIGNRLAPLTKSFITLLVNKGREATLPEIGKAFIGQYKEMKHIKTVTLTTAAPVSDAVRQSILKRATASLGDNQVELLETVDPEIIGGFVLAVDDKLFDASILHDLNEVRTQFTKNIYVSQLR